MSVAVSDSDFRVYDVLDGSEASSRPPPALRMVKMIQLLRHCRWRCNLVYQCIDIPPMHFLGDRILFLHFLFLPLTVISGSFRVAGQTLRPSPSRRQTAGHLLPCRMPKRFGLGHMSAVEMAVVSVCGPDRSPTDQCQVPTTLVSLTNSCAGRLMRVRRWAVWETLCPTYS